MTPDLIPHAPESAVAVTTAEAALVVEAGRKMAARLGLEFVVDAEKLAVFEAAGRRTPLPTLAPSGDEVAELRAKLRSAEATIAKAMDRETQALDRATVAEARNKVLVEALQAAEHLAQIGLVQAQPGQWEHVQELRRAALSQHQKGGGHGE